MFNPLEIFVNNALWSRIDVFFYLAVLFYIVYVVTVNRKVFYGYISDRRMLYSLLGIMVLALVVRIYFLDVSIQISDSVWEYVVAGKNFMVEGRLFKCYGPVFSNCPSPVPVSHPALYGLFVGILFLFTGFSLDAVLYMSIVASVLTLWLLYQLLQRTVESKFSVFVGLMALALVPIHAVYSGVFDGGLAVFSVIAGFMVILSTFLVSRDPENFGYWLLLSGSWVFSVSLRWENPLMVFFSVFYLVLNLDSPVETLKNRVADKRWSLMILLTFLLMVVPLKGIYTIWIRPDNLDSGFRMAYVLRNIAGGFRNMVRNFGVVGWSAVVLIPFSLKKSWRRTLPYLFFISAYFFTYTIFRNGLSLRYVMNLVPPLIMLLALGSDGFLDLFDSKKIVGGLLATVLSGAMLFSIAGFEGRNRDDDLSSLESVSEEYGDVPVVFPDTNTLLAYMGITTNSTGFGFLSLDKAYQNYGLEEVYFVETGRCRIDVFSGLCNTLKEQGKFEGAVGSWNVSRVRFDEGLRKNISRSISNSSY